MNLWALIPLFSCVAYAVLLVTTTLEIKKRVNRFFAWFLFASASWSIASFFLTYNPNASESYLIVWNNVVIVAIVWSIVAYHHFIRIYTNRSLGIVTYLGYSAVVVIILLAVLGYVVQDAKLVDGYLQQDLGPWVFILMAILLPIIIFTMVLLVKKLKSSRDKDERNMIKYMIVGLSIVAVYGPVNSNIPALSGLPTDHLGTLINAIIIGFAISKFKLLDFGLLARKFLSYTLTLIIAFGTYSGVVFLGRLSLGIYPIYVTLSAVIIIAVLVSLLFRPLFAYIQRKIDHLFHNYDFIYNKIIADFNVRTANTLELEKVSNDLLVTMGKSLRLTHADLLFPEASSGDFLTYATYPQSRLSSGDHGEFSNSSIVTALLAKEGKPIDVNSLSRYLETEDIYKKEKAELADPRLSILVPIMSHEKMIGIIALGHRQGGEPYRDEHIDLVIALARQAGIVIENAQLYSMAKERANVDELTGLFNHRYFHQRLDEEIARSSRFGEVFSLLIMDLDFFKSYNDIHGHLYGDNVLKKIGEVIKKNIRNIDIAFRYGGDEFAIIMPQASTDGAMKLAKRIQDKLEENDKRDDTLITCSIGLSTWPTDGVMREKLIEAADHALYYAKESGRNRIMLATQVNNTHNKGLPSNSNTMILNTIYALAATVDAKDHSTYGHSKKVSKYATDIATALGLSEEKISTIRTAGLLHDIGKIGISDDILSKSGPLSDDEWAHMHAHPTMGVSIIKHVDSIKDCLAAVHYHHERYDGTGYPSGLKGSNIPLDARILAIADAYDAMTSKRPYRKPYTQDQAMNEIMNCSGTQFDPEIVKVFATVILNKNIDEKVESNNLLLDHANS